MILTIKGLVLRSVKYGENDKLITVLTEEGKLFFKARGIRSLTSKNAAGCAAFVYSEFILDRRGDKCFLRRAQPLYTTVRAGADIQSLALAAYLAALAEDTARDAETGKMVLRLLMNALYLIAKEDRPTDLIKSVFEMRLLAANGLMPNLSECAVCQKPSDGFPYALFRPTEGDLLCPACVTSRDEGLLRVSPEVLSLLRRAVEEKEEKAYAVRVSAQTQRAVAAAAERFLIVQMDRTYPALQFYHQVCDWNAEPESQQHETV